MEQEKWSGRKWNEKSGVRKVWFEKWGVENGARKVGQGKWGDESWARKVGREKWGVKSGAKLFSFHFLPLHFSRSTNHTLLFLPRKWNEKSGERKVRQEK